MIIVNIIMDSFFLTTRMMITINVDAGNNHHDDDVDHRCNHIDDIVHHMDRIDYIDDNENF